VRIVESSCVPIYVKAEARERAQYFSCARKAVAYLEAHVAEPMTLQAAANAACMERTSFSKSFRRSTGVTFCKFVRAYRVSLAATMLEASDQPVVDIAYDVGFGDASTFERAFKRITGITPSAYRRSVIRNRWALPADARGFRVARAAGIGGQPIKRGVNSGGVGNDPG
jgi:AraC-like DNA-binding protein